MPPGGLQAGPIGYAPVPRDRAQFDAAREAESAPSRCRRLLQCASPGSERKAHNAPKIKWPSAPQPASRRFRRRAEAAAQIEVLREHWSRASLHMVLQPVSHGPPATNVRNRSGRSNETVTLAECLQCSSTFRHANEQFSQDRPPVGKEKELLQRDHRDTQGAPQQV